MTDEDDDRPTDRYVVLSAGIYILLGWTLRDKVNQILANCVTRDGLGRFGTVSRLGDGHSLLDRLSRNLSQIISYFLCNSQLGGWSVYVFFTMF